MSYRLAIIGSRKFNDYDLLCQELAKLPKPTVIVSGGAKGADSLGKKYADEHAIETKIFPAIWHPEGEGGPMDKGAGMKRNTDIIKEATAVLAFWDGDSTGTIDSINKAIIYKKFIKVVYVGLPQKKQDDKPILGFQGKFRWLSNMWPVEFELNGIKFMSSENAYQASKYAGRRETIEKIAKMPALETKSFVRDRVLNPWTTEDFDNKKLKFMKIFLEKKFENPCLRQKLINTGDVQLEEVNTWNDTFWGTCSGIGENNLGKLLMEIRAKLIDNEVNKVVKQELQEEKTRILAETQAETQS